MTDGQRRCINTRDPLVAVRGAQGESERKCHDGATDLTARAPMFFAEDRHRTGGESGTPGQIPANGYQGRFRR